MSTSGDARRQRAWGWLAHLREGGTTPWSAWSTPAPAVGRILPGAQQLELLRQLNLAAGAGRLRPTLVERVLLASAPGRGRPDLELVGAVEQRRFGPAPVDPVDLPAEELLRVAAGLLAEDLVARPLPARPVGRLRPWRTRYRLVGDPWLTAPVRSELIARGRPPGGRGSQVLVTGTNLDTMLTHAWASLAFSEGAASWPDWLRGVRRRGGVARLVDLPAIAAAWSQRVGIRRVSVVLDPARLPVLVGVRRPLPEAPLPAADAVDLARRVAAPLGLLVTPSVRADLLRRTLLPRLADAPGARLEVPEQHRGWMQERAAGMRSALREAGYPVHGDPDLLLPREQGGAGGAGESGGPVAAGVLELSMRQLLDGPGKEDT